MAELADGQLLNERYEVRGFIGRGGMSDVYLVWDHQRQADLALKLLHSDLAFDKIFLRRFEREAHALADLQHPNIVRFYGLERAGALAFMLMEYVDGPSLAEEVAQNAATGLPLARLLEVMRPVCRALQYAHNQGYIHCDVKPANVLVSQSGHVYLADFGIAHLAEGTATLSTSAVRAGTPAYMAPEQVRGEKPTRLTDMYALGVMLFEMITGGERPYTGERAEEAGIETGQLFWELANLPPQQVRDFRPDLSAELEQVVQRCFEKDPAQRFATPLDLLAALEGVILPGLPPQPGQELFDRHGASADRLTPSRPRLRTPLPTPQRDEPTRLRPDSQEVPKTPKPGLPQWFQDLAGDAPAPAPTPTPTPPPANDSVPDWIKDFSRALDQPADAADAPKKEDVLHQPQTPAGKKQPPAAPEPVTPPAQPAAGEQLPDWLREVGGFEALAGSGLADLATQAQPEPAPKPTPPLPDAEPELPDWLKSAGWLPEVELPDWLTGMQERNNPEAGEVKAPDINADDWISAWTDAIHQTPLTSGAPASLSAGIGESLPDWLKPENPPVKPPAKSPPAPAPADAAAPDWLKEMVPIAGPVAKPPVPPSAADLELPDWLRGVSVPPVPAQKSPAAKEPAAKPPAGKAAASKPSTTKTGAAKAPAAKEPSASEPAAKPPSAKAPAAREPAAKPSTAKESAAKPPASKTPAAKEPVVKTPAAKAPVAKKPAVTSPAARTPLQTPQQKPTTASLSLEKTAMELKDQEWLKGIPAIPIRPVRSAATPVDWEGRGSLGRQPITAPPPAKPAKKSSCVLIAVGVLFWLAVGGCVWLVISLITGDIPLATATPTSTWPAVTQTRAALTRTAQARATAVASATRANPSSVAPTAAKMATRTSVSPTIRASQTTLACARGASPVDGMALICVPAGTFNMGNNNGDASEKPLHLVKLAAFWIDATEVTNGMFNKFVLETRYQTDAEKEGTGKVYDDQTKNFVELNGATWKAPGGPGTTWNSRENYPVVLVSWNDATAYCQWAGRRLPTEAQWEMAARGSSGWLYPWGSSAPTGDLANFADASLGTEFSDKSTNDRYRTTAPVGSYPSGASPFGVLDLAGNVWEWTADWYDESYYSSSPNTEPAGPASGDFRVIRGGSFYSSAALVQSTFRYADVQTAHNSDIGFRCVR